MLAKQPCILTLALLALCLQPPTASRAQSSSSEVGQPVVRKRTSVPQERASLRALLQRAAHERAPIVMLFSRDDCAWCIALRREQFTWLGKESAARGIQVVEFRIDDDVAFPEAHDASGQLWSTATSPAALARHLRIRAVPTVVFVGPEGELAPRLIGYASPDFYPAYLEERIRQAREKLQTEPTRDRSQ